MRIKLQHAHTTDHGGDDPAKDYEREIVSGFYFEIQADGNHETLTVSEIYNSRIDAVAAINMFTEAGLEFEFVDETDG